MRPPQQARFRREVFARFYTHCLITGCETLIALEAARIHGVSNGGVDDSCNGIPLHADIHRLFDADLIILSSDGWLVTVSDSDHAHYGKFNRQSLAERIARSEKAADIVTMRGKRNLR